MMFSRVLVCAVAVVAFTGSTADATDTQCSALNDQGECNALHDFFNAVKKEDGSPLDWPFDGSNACMWPGLACNRKYRVNKLDLHDYKLSGTLPNSIGAFKFLSRAYLTSNKFHGTIPKSVTSIETLKYLDLAHNNLSGSIPDHIGNLKNLRWLYLNSNKFTGTIPEDLSKLESLWNLSLQYNELTGAIPESFGPGLTQLEHLTLHSNKLDSVPASFCDVTAHLVECRMQENMWACPREGAESDMPECALAGKCDACDTGARVDPKASGHDEL